MSYLKKIEYEIILKDSFWVLRNCSRCGGKTHFKNTKKFRVNANGNKLDIWLIYQCAQCKNTLNLAIYERQKASSIPPGEYQGFLENQEQLADAYGRNLQLFLKNKADVDYDRLNYDIVRRHESTENSESGERVLVAIKNPYGLKIRPEKQIAMVLGVSRSQVKSLMEQGEIKVKIKTQQRQSELLFDCHSQKMLDK